MVKIYAYINKIENFCKDLFIYDVDTTMDLCH